MNTALSVARRDMGALLFGFGGLLAVLGKRTQNNICHLSVVPREGGHSRNRVLLASLCHFSRFRAKFYTIKLAFEPLAPYSIQSNNRHLISLRNTYAVTLKWKGEVVKYLKSLHVWIRHYQHRARISR